MVAITPHLRDHLAHRAASLRENVRVAAANNHRYVNPGDVEGAEAEANDIDRLLERRTFLERDRIALVDLIKTRLVGVAPDDQDLVLEDADWQLIVAALQAA